MSEKKSPDCLPAGWTVEHKLRKSGKKDKYYTDPVSGYVFRSLKDVHRYLKTGDVGRLAFKPKDISHVDMELEDDKLPTQTGAGGHKSADGGTSGQITACKSSKLFETVNDEQILESCTADHMCGSANASEPCKEIAAVTDVNLPEANGSEGREEKIESTGRTLVSDPLIGTSPEKRPLENGLEEHGIIQLEINKSSKKSRPSLPRRVSKRLAGIEVNLPPEPKTRRQAMARRAGEAATSTAGLATLEEHDGKAETDNTPSLKQVYPIVLPQASHSIPEEHGGEVEIDNKSRERQELHIVLPLASLSTPEEHGGNAEMDNKPSEKQELHIDLPPASFSSPEERAVKVETDNKPSEKEERPIVLPPVNLSSPKEQGGEAETEKIPKARQELPTPEERGAKVEMDNNQSEKQERPVFLLPASLYTPEEFGGKVDKNNMPSEKQESPIVTPPVNVLIPEECAGGVKTDNKADVKPESPVNLSLTDLWTDPCIEFAVKTLTGAIPIGDEDKANDFPGPGSPLDLPLRALWTDPCIEFAVKTLTGAIPVGEDLSIPDYFQQRASSLENQGENGFTMWDVGLNNFCQTDLLSKHFGSAENSLHKQQDLVVPMLPNHRNVSLQNSGSSGLHQHVKGSSGECSRPTFF